MKRTETMVSVCTLTYNHAPFLRQCLDGILMQQTDFAFEILIHDDASTDGAQDIIREYEREYPDIVKPIYQTENQFSKGVKISATYQYPRAKGKYIALCEGDDYWTDPHKLQRQVDFLENHLEFVMCSCQYKTYDQKMGLYGSCNFGTTDAIEYNLETLVRGFWYFHPLTVLFKSSALDLERYKRYPILMDAVLFYELLKHGKGYCLPDVMAVYRVHNGGIWSGVSLDAKRDIEFKARLGIYGIDKSVDAAKYLLSQFAKPMNAEWLILNYKMTIRVLHILRKHFGWLCVLKILWKKILFAPFYS